MINIVETVVVTAIVLIIDGGATTTLKEYFDVPFKNEEYDLSDVDYWFNHIEATLEQGKKAVLLLRWDDNDLVQIVGTHNVVVEC